MIIYNAPNELRIGVRKLTIGRTPLRVFFAASRRFFVVEVFLKNIGWGEVLKNTGLRSASRSCHFAPASRCCVVSGCPEMSIKNGSSLVRGVIRSFKIKI